VHHRAIRESHRDFRGISSEGLQQSGLFAGHQPVDVQELLDHDAKVVVLSRGMAECLGVPRETRYFGCGYAALGNSHMIFSLEIPQ
jgi:hypothetical protein